MKKKWRSINIEKFMRALLNHLRSKNLRRKNGSYLMKIWRFNRCRCHRQDLRTSGVVHDESGPSHCIQLHWAQSGPCVAFLILDSSLPDAGADWTSCWPSHLPRRSSYWPDWRKLERWNELILRMEPVELQDLEMVCILPCREAPADPMNSIKEMGDSDSCGGISTDMRRPGDPDLSIPPTSKPDDVTMSQEVCDLGDIEAKAMVESAEDGPGENGSSIGLVSSNPASSLLNHKDYSCGKEWKKARQQVTWLGIAQRHLCSSICSHDVVPLVFQQSGASWHGHETACLGAHVLGSEGASDHRTWKKNTRVQTAMSRRSRWLGVQIGLCWIASWTWNAL